MSTKLAAQLFHIINNKWDYIKCLCIQYVFRYFAKYFQYKILFDLCYGLITKKGKINPNNFNSNLCRKMKMNPIVCHECFA